MHLAPVLYGLPPRRWGQAPDFFEHIKRRAPDFAGAPFGSTVSLRLIVFAAVHSASNSRD